MQWGLTCSFQKPFVIPLHTVYLFIYFLSMIYYINLYLFVIHIHMYLLYILQTIFKRRIINKVNKYYFCTDSNLLRRYRIIALSTDESSSKRESIMRSPAQSSALVTKSSLFSRSLSEHTASPETSPGRGGTSAPTVSCQPSETLERPSSDVQGRFQVVWGPQAEDC